MLKIDRLRLSLPAGYEARADRIARLVADELAGLPVHGDAHFDQLTLPTVEVGPRATDAQVAGAVTRAMASHLAAGSAGVPPATNQVTSPAGRRRSQWGGKP